MFHVAGFAEAFASPVTLWLVAATVGAVLSATLVTLLLSISLVVMVIFLFLRNAWATIIPSIAVPLSLVGTFAVMYLANFSLNNLSLMALTIATGFVVDDAVVVLENVVRHVESGMDVHEAALVGSGEVSFTVVSMSLSLIAVFIPILLFPGIIGLLFHEFAVTLSIAILICVLFESGCTRNVYTLLSIRP